MLIQELPCLDSNIASQLLLIDSCNKIGPQRTLMGLHSATSSTVGLAECRIHKETRDAAGRAGARSQGCLPGGRRFYRGRDRGFIAWMVMLECRTPALHEKTLPDAVL